MTAGLLDDLRTKCAAQADRYGLRFVEAPVEQIKDVSLKCAYRAPISIPLALAPPVIPDLHLRLAEQGHGTGQPSNYFEYAILTQKFGFVLDVEASDRYPDTIQVEYTYRGNTPFEYSQFIHRSGLALVQCLGEEGFIWCDNRLFIAAPTRGRGTGTGSEAYPGAPVPAKLTKQEEARQLRVELAAFCTDPEKLRKFYDEVTPPALAALPAVPNSADRSSSLESEVNGATGSGSGVMSPGIRVQSPTAGLEGSVHSLETLSVGPAGSGRGSRRGSRVSLGISKEENERLAAVSGELPGVEEAEGSGPSAVGEQNGGEGAKKEEATPEDLGIPAVDIAVMHD